MERVSHNPVPLAQEKDNYQCFINRDELRDDNLRCGQCDAMTREGRRCTKTTCLGLTFCSLHLKKIGKIRQVRPTEDGFPSYQATQDLPRGTLLSIGLLDVSKLDPPQNEVDLWAKYAATGAGNMDNFVPDGKGMYYDMACKRSYAAYFEYSDDPNVQWDPARGVLIVIRNIQRGHILTWAYKTRDHIKRLTANRRGRNDNLKRYFDQDPDENKFQVAEPIANMGYLQNGLAVNMRSGIDLARAKLNSYRHHGERLKWYRQVERELGDDAWGDTEVEWRVLDFPYVDRKETLGLQALNWIPEGKEVAYWNEWRDLDRDYRRVFNYMARRNERYLSTYYPYNTQVLPQGYMLESDEEFVIFCMLQTVVGLKNMASEFVTNVWMRRNGLMQTDNTTLVYNKDGKDYVFSLTDDGKMMIAGFSRRFYYLAGALDNVPEPEEGIPGMYNDDDNGDDNDDDEGSPGPGPVVPDVEYSDDDEKEAVPDPVDPPSPPIPRVTRSQTRPRRSERLRNQNR